MRSLVSCLILTVSVFITSGATAGQTIDRYDQMIAAVEAWLRSQPVREFTDPSDEQAFRWKVQLERVERHSPDHFLFLASLLSEIGAARFTYQYYDYHAASVRARMVDIYPLCTYSERPHVWAGRERQMPSLGQFVEESYLWYKQNIVSIREQTHWLMLLLGCLSSFIVEEDAARFASENEQMIHEMLMQYLACCQYYLEEHRDKIMNIGNVYHTTTVWATTQSAVDTMLEPLAAFCIQLGSRIAAETREMVLRFVVPKYADRDLAVKIYVALTKP